MKKLFKLFIVIGFTLILTGCMTTKQKVKLDEITDNGLKYMKNKYNQKFELVSSKYDYTRVSGLGITGYDENKVYIELKDNIEVYYDGNKYYDNYQSKDIKEALMNEIWNPMFKNNNIYYDIEPTFKSKYGNNYELVYHEYFNNNIDEFLKNEDIYISKSNIYVLSSSENDWQERFENINKVLNRYFSSNSIKIFALTNDLYQKKSSYETFNIGIDGCLAIQYGNDLTIKNYIKPINDISITSDTPNFVLEKDDIKLVDTKMSKTELENIVNSSKYTKQYTINENTPIYKLELSERIKSKFKNYISLYIKVKNDSNVLSDNYLLLSYDLNSNQYAFHQINLKNVEYIRTSGKDYFLLKGTKISS